MTEHSTLPINIQKQCSQCGRSDGMTDWCIYCQKWMCDDCKHPTEHLDDVGLCLICETLPINGILCFECGGHFCPDCRDNRSKDVEEKKQELIAGNQNYA